MMRLFYFNIPGRAEAIRLLLNHAGVRFEDVRIPFSDWPKYKDKFELKRVPVLEVNGTKFCQSTAILQYLGVEYGYFPKKGFDKISEIMFVVNSVEDLFSKTFPLLTPSSDLYDEKTKGPALKDLLDFRGPLYMKALENRLKANTCQKFMVGNDYTIADFALLGLYRTLLTNPEWYNNFADRIAKKYPTLQAYAETRMKDFNPYYKACEPKLYYFDMPGRAEMIRMILKYLKYPFEDVKIKFEDWDKEKASGKFEMQMLPVFQCNPCGVNLSQSDSIIQDIGAHFGLLPRDNPEQFYRVLWWCNTAKDILEGCYRDFLPISEDKKKAASSSFFANSVPVFLQAMEGRLKANESKMHLVGQSYTIADFYVMGVYRAVINNPEYPGFSPILMKCPTLNEYFKAKDKEF